MHYTLTCDGVPVGSVELPGAAQATGRLTAAAGYDGSPLRRSARRLGIALRVVGWRRVDGRVAARALAAALGEVAGWQGRLGLVDERGAAAAVARVLLVEFPGDPAPWLVADLGGHAAAFGATRRAAVGPEAGAADPPRPDEALRLVGRPAPGDAPPVLPDPSASARPSTRRPAA